KIIRFFAFAAIGVLFTASRSTAASVPPDFERNAVQFIFRKAGTNYFPFGTCFLIDMAEIHYPYWYLNPVPGYSPRNQHCPYIITARHVLLDTNSVVHPELYIRAAMTTGGVQYDLLNPVLTNQLRIITHTNRGVDLAAITFRGAYLIPTLT